MYISNDDAQPIVLTLGPVTGLAIQPRYGRNFWGRTVVTGIDKRVTIALVDPPDLFVILGGSFIAHRLAKAVLDEGVVRTGWGPRGPSYRWRWRWRTLCGAWSARICTPGLAVVPQPSVTFTDSIWPWHRLCHRCGAALGRRGDVAPYIPV